jgi:threonine synthase
MVTQKGDNTYVIGIKGNFDDAQTGVKNIFSDKELEKVMNDAGFQFSSANSINIGRLVPQIVYYVYAYAKLLANGEIKDGEKINVVVPTGNFGNILAAFYAKNMGLPINKFICASNENKVLYDFFATGEYDRNREFVLTTLTDKQKISGPLLHSPEIFIFSLDSKNLLNFITHLIRIAYSIMKNWCRSDFFNCVRNFDIAYLAKLIYKFEVSH